MKYALMANCDPQSDRYKQLGPHVFVRELFDVMPEFHADLEQDIREVDDTVEENWIYNLNGDGQFTPPPPPPDDPNPPMRSAAFLTGLSNEEYAALVKKSQDAIRADSHDATMLRFYDLLRIQQTVRVNDDLTKAAKKAMVKAGVLTQA